jgi:hypothetical protein
MVALEPFLDVEVEAGQPMVWRRRQSIVHWRAATARRHGTGTAHTSTPDRGRAARGCH